MHVLVEPLFRDKCIELNVFKPSVILINTSMLRLRVLEMCEFVRGFVCEYLPASFRKRESCLCGFESDPALRVFSVVVNHMVTPVCFTSRWFFRR